MKDILYPTSIKVAQLSDSIRVVLSDSRGQVVCSTDVITDFDIQDILLSWGDWAFVFDNTTQNKFLLRGTKGAKFAEGQLDLFLSNLMVFSYGTRGVY